MSGAQGAGRVAFDGGLSPLPPGAETTAAWGRTLAAAVRRGVRDLDLLDMPTLEAALTLARDAVGSSWNELRVFLPAARADAEDVGSLAPATAVRCGTAEIPPPRPGVDGESGLVFRSLEEAEAALPTGLVGPGCWAAVPAHLLRGNQGLRVLEAWRSKDVPVLVRDVLARGRLAGAVGGVLAAPSPRGPPRLSELEASWAPVLRLAFLTRSRVRTLPQAALAFAWSVGAVPSVRFRDPRDVASWLPNGAGAPLTEPELEQLRSLGDTDGSAPGTGPRSRG